MTEDEWHVHKKEIKTTRERDRRKRAKERKGEAALNARTPEEIEAVKNARTPEEVEAVKKEQSRKRKNQTMKEYRKRAKEAASQACSTPKEIEAELSIASAHQNKIVSTPSTSTLRRSLRKRKAAPTNMQESDLDNNNDDDDNDNDNDDDKREALVSDFLRRRE